MDEGTTSGGWMKSPYRIAAGHGLNGMDEAPRDATNDNRHTVERIHIERANRSTRTGCSKCCLRLT